MPLETHRQGHRDSKVGGSLDGAPSRRGLWGEDNVIEELFKNPSRERERKPHEELKWYQNTMKIFKILTYCVVILLVLGSSVMALMTILLMTSQLEPYLKRPICLRAAHRGEKQVEISFLERVQWTWGLLFCLLVPEILTFLRSLRLFIFKKCAAPTLLEFLLPCFFELSHAVGLALFTFVILPSEPVIKGVMLLPLLCLIPSILALLSRYHAKNNFVWIGLGVVDFGAILIQIYGLILWPYINSKNSEKSLGKPWLLPLAAILTSFGWTENYLSKNSKFGIIKALGRTRRMLEETRHKSYMLISLLKMVAYLLTMCLSIWLWGDNPDDYFKNLVKSFQNSTLRWSYVGDSISNGFQNSAIITQKTFSIENSPATFQLVLVLQFLAAYFCYICSKYACQICMQEISFAFPLTLTTPVTLAALLSLCGARTENVCYANFLPPYLYWNCPQQNFASFIKDDYGWVWILIFLSHMWVTCHVWRSQKNPLPATETLFCHPMYNAICPSLDLLLNRKRSEDDEQVYNDLEKARLEENVVAVDTKVDSEWDTTPKIYACATLWHEKKEEMTSLFKSILRMDQDQNMWKQTLEFVHVRPRGYYEFGTHIFFDDAFIRHRNSYKLNSYVRAMIQALTEACRHVHEEAYTLRPPKIISTPYGGKLEWSLPGGTNLSVHLKNNDKIRNKKRFSQIMYMYYLLGFGIKYSHLSEQRQKVIGQNTFLLTLDGDIDFQPKAVKLLLDLMKKNKNLGAACGRIHPVGEGPIVWFQTFEYAIGHWLQKATEHAIGCVLCSPGCFSLFRAEALMDDGVMAKYTRLAELPRHCVQFDQGEDRWLCTLLLQQKWKIEYCAASDSYTNSPESFDEFYNQRRRWIPSTLANNLDLLMDYKETLKRNDNISLAFIVYQVILFVGSILGPGMIFLMLLGAFVAAFKIDNYTSLYINVAPIVGFMIVCFVCKKEVQLALAKLLSAIYILVMVAVLIAIILQMIDDGLLAPSSIFLGSISFSFIIAALIHPLELSCLLHGFLYYLTIPSMYLLLIIYSLFNLNDVSWGTRDGGSQPEKQGVKKKKAILAGIIPGWNSNFNGRRNDGKLRRGYLDFAFGTLCEIYCCLSPQTEMEINLYEEIERPIQIEKIQNTRVEVNSNKEEFGVEPLVPFWFQDEALLQLEAEVDYLMPVEVKFWEEVIPALLKPVPIIGEQNEAQKEKSENMKKGLRDLRNKVVAAFFMMNAILITILFLLQVNKDKLYINWPLGQTHNMTYDHPDIIIVHTNYLHLEPFGLLFIACYALILLVQFLSMILHRFETFSLIIASTALWPKSKKLGSQDDWVDEIGREELEIIRSIHGAKRASQDTELEGIQNGRWPRKRVHSMDVTFVRRFEKVAQSPRRIRRVLGFVENPEVKMNHMKSVRHSNMERGRIWRDSRTVDISKPMQDRENNWAGPSTSRR